MSDPNLLTEGYVSTVIFMSENIVYIDGSYYSYSANIGDISCVRLVDSYSNLLFEWNLIFSNHLPFGWPERPDTPICVRTADGESFDSLTAAMHHIMGYLARGETMPVLVNLDSNNSATEDPLN